jgi:hypothetical protein
LTCAATQHALGPARISIRRAAILFALAVSGCALEVHRSPVEFFPAMDSQVVLRVRDPATVQLPTGYSRLIKGGSRWRLIGRTPQGDVYQPVGDVFTIEGANTHEAYLVLAAGHLVGFYLVGEGAYSPLREKIRLATD